MKGELLEKMSETPKCFVCGKPKNLVWVKDHKNKRITIGIECGCGLTIVK